MLLDLLLETLRSLRAHRLRFALTSLGIFWGAAMLTFLSAYGLGIERGFKTQLEKTGPRTIWMFPGALVKDRVGERGARRLELEAEDVERLRALAVVEHATVDDQYWNRIVRAGSRTKLLTVVGLDAEGLTIRNFEAAQGRMLMAADVDGARRVAFLGAEAARRLFGARSPIGREVHVESIPFRVVGVAVRKGDQLINMGDRDDNLVMVPHTAARRTLSDRRYLDRFLVAPVTRQRSAEASSAVRSVLALHHGFRPDSALALGTVAVNDTMTILDALFLGLDVFLVGVAVVTLLVGAIGVMNIMLVVVGERVREIGLRKAIGATDRSIFALFLCESAAVAGLSGIAGSALGYAAVRLLDALTPPEVATRPLVDWRILGLVFVSLLAVGIVSGVAPALRAARVVPAESLRSVG